MGIHYTSVAAPPPGLVLPLEFHGSGVRPLDCKCFHLGFPQLPRGGVRSDGVEAIVVFWVSSVVVGTESGESRTMPVPGNMAFFLTICAGVVGWVANSTAQCLVVFTAAPACVMRLLTVSGDVRGSQLLAFKASSLLEQLPSPYSLSCYHYSVPDG